MRLVNVECGSILGIQAITEIFLSTNRLSETSDFLQEALKDNTV